LKKNYTTIYKLLIKVPKLNFRTPPEARDNRPSGNEGDGEEETPEPM